VLIVQVIQQDIVKNMAVKTKAQLLSENTSTFADNTSGDITPALERAFNTNFIDSVATLSDDNDYTGVNTHSKEVRWHKGANLTAASTLSLGVTGNYHHVTGNTAITELSTKQHGTRMLLYFSGTPLLTHSSALILPNAANIQVDAGDIAEFVSEGSGNWRCTGYLKSISSGTYTPASFTDSIDMVTTLLSPMTFTVIGAIVTVYFNISIQLSNGATQGDTIFAPPILPTNDFSDTNQAFGAITPLNYDSFTYVYVQSKTLKDIQIGFAGATANSNINFKGSFSYNKNN
jgi:hypothetical protein